MHLKKMCSIQRRTLSDPSTSDMLGQDVLVSGALQSESARVPSESQTIDLSQRVSPSPQQLVQLSKVSAEKANTKPERLLDKLPDCVTSPEGIGEVALASLKFV